MAQYDGAIRIVTKITTKDAKESLYSLEYTIKKSAKEIDSLRAKMDALKNQKISTKEWKDLEKELSEAEKELSELIKTRDEWANLGVNSGLAWEDINNKIKAASSSVDLIKEKMQSLTNAGKDFTLGKDTAEYKSYEKQIGYEEKAIAEAGRHYKSLVRTKDGYEKLKKTATSALQGIGSVAKKAAIAPFKLLGNTAKNAFLNIGKASKKSEGMLSTFGSRFKSLALSLLIFNQISKAFNAMVSGMREGFSNLSNENASFRNQVNGLKASLLTLKNAFAGAFAPIVQIAIPYIQQLIGWLTSAISAVGQFIAALTGRKTYTKAIQQTAGAFEDAAGAANDAKEAVEGYLNPLDEINKHNDGKDKGVGAGGGGGAGGAGQMFEEVPIESKFKDIADKLKSFIKSEDWEGLGAYIASGINKGLQKIYDVINWDNVGPRITYFVNAFTRTFNSLVDNIDWDLMGRVVGAGINTIVNTLNLLIEGIDWKNLGKKFSEGIMGIVREVNWENVGRFFGNKIMILWDTLYGLIMNLKYDEIGDAIGDGLNGAVKAINLGTIGATLGRAITGLFQTAINFADTFEWKSLGRNISDGINRFFQEFDGKTVAQGATKLISGILDTLIEAISTTDWSEVWKDIIDFLVNVNWAELIVKFHVVAGMLIVGLFKGLVQAIAETDWGEVWDSILDAFKSIFGIHSPSTVMEEMGKYLIQGLLEGINGLADTVRQAWQSMKETAITIWNNTKEGLSTTWNNIKNNAKTVFDNVKTNISNAWNNAKQNTRTAWENMKSNVITAAQNIASNVRSKYENIKSSIRSFASSAPSIWRGAWDTMKNAVSSVLGTIKNTVSSAFSWISSKAKSIGSSLKNLISKASSVGNSRASYSFARSAYSVPSPYTLYPAMATVDTSKIPGYATGQVIPTTMKKHLAILGDNNRETEVVSPLSTMKQAFMEAITEMGGMGGNSGGTIIIKQYLDGKQVAESVVKEGKVRQMATGNNMFMLGTT